MNILEKKNLDFSGMRIFSNFYYNQKAIIREWNEMSEERQMRKVSDKAAFSHLESLVDKTAGIKINLESIYSLHYAVYTLIIAENVEENDGQNC